MSGFMIEEEASVIKVTDQLAIEKIKDIKLSIEEFGVSKQDVLSLEELVKDNFITKDFNINKLTSTKSNNGKKDILERLNNISLESFEEAPASIADVVCSTNNIVYSLDSFYSTLDRVISSKDIKKTIESFKLEKSYTYVTHEGEDENVLMDTKKVGLIDFISYNSVETINETLNIKLEEYQVNDILGSKAGLENISVFLNALTDDKLHDFYYGTYNDVTPFTIGRFVDFLENISAMTERLKKFANEVRSDARYLSMETSVSYKQLFRMNKRAITLLDTMNTNIVSVLQMLIRNL